ncbi:hypothetical protein AMTRI_Chr02g219250 [Amborella trichopoda]
MLVQVHIQTHTHPHTYIRLPARPNSNLKITNIFQTKRGIGKSSSIFYLISSSEELRDIIYLFISYMSISYGWGESFHFAPRLKGESFRESIKRYEHFIALQLGLKPGMKGIGCGVRNCLTSITALNNNEYQLFRGIELNRIAGLDKTCDFVKPDFMKMPFPDDTFDAIYTIEGTCHAADVVGCYKEICRVLKPGQCFAAYEWCMTDSFDPNNQEHQKIRILFRLCFLCIGDGLPDIRTTGKINEALIEAGFEVLWQKDVAAGSPVPWYLPLDNSPFSFSSFRAAAPGRFITQYLVKFLEYIHIAPEGSHKVSSFLETAAKGLVEGGKKEIFTPHYFFVARKPHE